MRQLGLAVASLSLLVAGCASGGLPKAVKSLNPDLFVIRPASGRSGLGLRPDSQGRAALGDQCVTGPLASYASYDSVALSYKNAWDSKLKLDLGGKVKAVANAGPTTAIKVTLKNLREVAIDTLFIDPASSCISSDGTDTLEVYSRALRVQGLSLSQASSAGVGVSLTVKNDTVNATLSSQRNDTIKGDSLLFIARGIQRIEVMRQSEDTVLGATRSLSLGECTFVLESVQSTWSGSLSCPRHEVAPLSAMDGVFDYVDIAPGVTFAVRVSRSGLSEGAVELRRYTVHPIGIRRPR